MSGEVFLSVVRVITVVGLIAAVTLGVVGSAYVVRNIIAEWRRP